MNRRQYLTGVFGATTGIGIAVGDSDGSERPFDPPTNATYGNDTLGRSSVNGTVVSAAEDDRPESPSLDVRIFTEPNPLDTDRWTLTKPVEPARHVGRAVRYALTRYAVGHPDLTHEDVSVRVRSDPLTLDGVESRIDLFRAFEDWLGDNPDERAVDANYLVSPMRTGGLGYAPTCQIDDSCSTLWDADVAVGGYGRYLYAPYVEQLPNHFRDLHNGAPVDADGDVAREDVNGDGEIDFEDVIEFVFEYETADVPTYDFDSDEDVDFVDVTELVFEIAERDGRGPTIPRLVSTEAYGFALSMAVHEVGHNLGFQHDMGTAVGTDERVRISPMLGAYYFQDDADAPSQGERNRVGDTIPPLDGRTPYYELTFGTPIQSHPDWLYDERT